MEQRKGITTKVPPVAPIKGQVKDSRPASLGLARILMALLLGFIIGSSVRSLSSLPGATSDYYAWSLLSLLSILVWVAVAVGIIHNGRKMRILAYTGLGAQIVGLVAVNLAQHKFIGASHVLVFSDWGRELSYFPCIVPVICLAWLAWSSPRLRKI